MLLSAPEIADEMRRKRIRIEPFVPSLLRRASYTLRLGNCSRRWKRAEKPILMWSKDASLGHLEDITNSTRILISQGDFILASTKESITLPDNIAGLICTLSHVARFGLTATAGSLLVRPGFGHDKATSLTLELASLNPSPLEFPIGLPICHLAFLRLSQPIVTGVKSVYENFGVPCPPMLYEDLSETIEKLDGGENNLEMGQ